MCWSPTVSLAFALGETIALLFLWRRRARFDRDNVLLHLPLVVQEVLQALLWPHVSADRSESAGWADQGLHQCTRYNAGYSYALLVVITAVPVWWTHRVAREDAIRHEEWASEGEGAHGWIRARMLLSRPAGRDRFTRMATVIRRLHALLALVFAWLYLRADATKASHWCATCTTRGPHGHQVWPFMVWPNKAVEIAFFVVYFSISGGGIRLLSRPTLFPLAIGVLAVATVPLYIFLGAESGSIWCWAASTLVFMYIIEPHIIDRFGLLDPSTVDIVVAKLLTRAQKQAVQDAGRQALPVRDTMWGHVEIDDNGLFRYAMTEPEEDPEGPKYDGRGRPVRAVDALTGDALERAVDQMVSAHRMA